MMEGITVAVKKGRKFLTVIMMCAALIWNAFIVYAQDDEKDFTIVEGVLEKYSGSASEVMIPEGVTTIGTNAFANNKTITKVTLPSTLTTIGKAAFYGCTNLDIPEFPASVTTIEEEAFGLCYASEEEVTIPASITNIGPWAFHLCGSEKITINGNNSALSNCSFGSGFLGAEDCSRLDHLEEVVLNGTFTNISGAFNGRTKLQSVTLNGTIEKLSDGFYACEALQTLTVNEDINEITSSILSDDRSIFATSPDLTIYGKDGSHIQEYAEKYGIPFVVIETEEPSVMKNEISLTESNTTISKADMLSLIDTNKVEDVIVRTNEGVFFTFPKDSMKMIDKDMFDFGIKMITEYDEAGLNSMGKDIFVFRINYNYSGELPGTAQVSVPIDAKWNSQELYYYQVDGNGKLIDQNISAPVINGVYTIPLTHCSDYIAVTKKLSDSDGSPSDSDDKKQTISGNSKNPLIESNDRDTETDDVGKIQLSENNSKVSDTDSQTQIEFIPAAVSTNTNTNQASETSNVANASMINISPQTGDSSAFLLYIVFILGAVGVTLTISKYKISTK